jgi:hypothetical protein
MAEERVERRLAAILAADVAGYSRLMGQDEEATLVALKNLLKSVIEPKISENRGRIVKTTGDGVLAEFASAVDAARCALISSASWSNAMPASSQESIREIEDLASPVRAFVREWCMKKAAESISVKELFRAYQAWADETGHSFTTSCLRQGPARIDTDAAL